jgi:hypothetical protein
MTVAIKIDEKRGCVNTSSLFETMCNTLNLDIFAA